MSNKQKYTCKRCGFDFDTVSNLVRHLKKINICKALFSDKDRNELISELPKYSKSKILEDGTKVYLCKYCGKEFNLNPSKSRHEKNCNNKETYNKLEIINKKLDKLIETPQILNQINNGTIVNMTNPTINNYNGDFYITNIDEFNAKLLKENSNHLLNIGTYMVDNFLEDKCKYFIDCVQECKKEALSNYNFTIVTHICKVLLESNNPLTKNMFMDKSDDNHAYINLKGRFYWIHLNDLVELFCVHIPEVIKKLVQYKDRLDEMDRDDKDFVKFELDRFLSLTLDERKNEIIDLLTKHLIENKKLIEDFMQKAIPIEELQQLKPDDKFIFNIRDEKIARLEYQKLGIRSKELKIKRLRQIKTYIEDYDSCSESYSENEISYD